MKRKLVFATNNAHKLEEVAAILGDQIELLSLNDIGCHTDIPETAETLEGNALLKSSFIFKNYGLDCFADDTGLEVEALDGAPGVYSALGIYIPLIVVNCIILGRAEAYAGKHGPIPSLFDGIGMGLGFTVGLTLIGMFRELIGAGTLFGIQVMPSAYEPVNIFIMAPGAFLVLAMLVAVQNRIKRQKSEKTGKPAVPAEETGCMACANKAYCQAVKGKEEAK